MVRFAVSSLVALLVVLQAAVALTPPHRLLFTISSAVNEDTVKVPDAPTIWGYSDLTVNSDKYGVFQLWRFTPYNKYGHLRITNPATNLAVAAPPNSFASSFGNPVVVVPKDIGSPWRLESVLGKPYSIIRHGDTEFVWTRREDKIFLTPYRGYAEQQWIVDVEPESA
ncbi:hypothetical protein DFQ27_000865 [Actinomortierella ambigua]|uniref:Ricin B lectin domain-containing protein n=1 Tax=Actinomortierella ambigua TaxID=1343610 RepID=A0A9P6PLQ7_9FUNG|nr:hypothetical protein DFQ27_000865 [Actinomortierella ambigua]